jgi:hypothetical protein
MTQLLESLALDPTARQLIRIDTRLDMYRHDAKQFGLTMVRSVDVSDVGCKNTDIQMYIVSPKFNGD